MDKIYKVADLEDKILELKSVHKTIGFIPTMGALHEGHISLVKQSKKENNVTIVSIFVNPTQFNNKADLEKYPRDEEKDIEMLSSVGADIIFIPSVEEIYPEPDTRIFDFGELDKVMEGQFRPGHFNGVAQVVSRLFSIVQPDRAYFGEKDFQQLAVVRSLVKQCKIPVLIVGMPILRENSGLAMSSRNQRLSSDEFQKASVIYRTLLESKDVASVETIGVTHDFVTDKINQTGDLTVEYFDIVNGHTLQTVSSWDDADYIVGCIAVFCGEVRLIDNITYKGN